jgi:hypothetical protein
MKTLTATTLLLAVIVAPFSSHVVERSAEIAERAERI